MPTDPRGLRGDAPLLDAWLRFHEDAPTPFTIPGHKQRHDLVGDVVAGDVPLHAGLDTMKLSGGLLRDAEARAADLWGVDLCRFSVGGSTHGNQALALAVARSGRGRKVVVSRTLHRSLFLGLVLAGLEPVWIRPEVDPRLGLPTGVDPERLSAVLDQHPDAAAVFVGEPSYVGSVGDVAGLAEVARSSGVPLIVDAAWAPHFGFHPDLPEHALALGAEAIVISAHKALPAWSQAALVLARAGGRLRLDEAALDVAIEATATTSPAGALLASTDAARALLAQDGPELIGSAIDAVRDLRDRLRRIDGLVLLDGAGADPLKVALVLPGTGVDGNAVEQDLIDAGFPLEMADRDTLVAQVTLADDEQTVAALGDALEAAITRHRGQPRKVVPAASCAVEPTVALSPRLAFLASSRPVDFAAARGRISGELIAPYPPGVPVVAPGEVVTDEVLDGLDAAREAGIRIAYAADPTLRTLRVLE